ncbi:PepSY domain-containing protein [Neobacillus cucumis]|nr:PepSY domain-containing protein [Neobacillus cucumis]
MKKTRRAHLWIGLIASIFIFMESLTGLLMNEPWLIGQTQGEGIRGNFQPGEFNQQFSQGSNSQGSGQASGQPGMNNNGQFQGRRGFGGNRNFNPGMFKGESQGMMGIIRGLHEGRIGTTNIKWLIDLVAIALMALTGTGIYLSIKVLSAERKRKNRSEDPSEVL